MNYCGISGAVTSNTICIDAMNSNSNSMMDTCDTYPSPDCTSATSSCSILPTTTQNGFSTTFNCSQALPSTSGTQHNRPIKSDRVTGQLKKAKSLENIRVENTDGSLSSHEMEFVATRFAARFKLN